MSLGPGDPCLLTPLAREALLRARAVVGYSGYIGLIEPGLLAGRTVFSTGMTGEVERCRKAVEFARAGLPTAVVCGGDAGIYAMAGLVLEVLEAENLIDRVPFEVVPGVPALAAAAALLGAPLMHDFACVSLSDLLTPWEVIEKRLTAAACADFVIVLYNPRSRNRPEHLARALELIGRHRGPDTPVGAVSRAYRPGQSVSLARLSQFDPQGVDMQTVLVVGNSATRPCGRFLLTPRGYERKYGLAGASAGRGGPEQGRKARVPAERA